jgi:hypothetical protein
MICQHTCDLLGSRIPGGSGETPSWRNLLNTDVVPWLKGHKLGDSIIFPAAGYIAMATVTIQQLQLETLMDHSTIIFQDLKFIRMLELQDQHEIFTELRKQHVSEVTDSSSWWHVSISSFTSGTSIVHMRGMVSIGIKVPSPSRQVESRDNKLERQSPRSWYKSLAAVGLCFDPNFQSLQDIYHDAAGNCYRTIANTQLIHTTGFAHESSYTVHPIIIDALLQTAILSSSAGRYANLHGRIPVTISYMEIRQDAGKLEPSDICTINAESEAVGFGPIKYNTELRDGSGNVLVQIKNGRGIPYEECEAFQTEH